MTPAELTPPQQADLIRDFSDHRQFCSESLQLRNRLGSLEALKSWPSQVKLNAAIEKQRRQGKPVRVLVLKTRRSGFTVGTCSQIFHEVPFFPGRRATIIADHYNPAALEAFGYLKEFAHSYTPFSRHGCAIGLPELVSDAGEALEWANGSTIEVFSADRAEIRGGGRHWALFDEVAFWRAAALTLRSAINMVPALAETGIVMQSTANGVGGEFYERCQSAMDPQTAEGWAFVFFGWLEDPNNRKAFDTRDDRARFQDSLVGEDRILHEHRGATLEQLHWRRWKIRTDFNGRVDDFHQEYPTTPDEAFLSTGRPALTISALARMPAWKEPAVGELEEIEEYPRKRMQFIIREGGALTIGTLPDPARQYVVAADPAKGIDVSGDKRGKDPDYSVAGAFDLRTGEQVAQFRARVRPVAFAGVTVMLAKFFNYAFLVPESNDAGFIDAILNTNYPLELLYNTRRDPTDRKPLQPQEIGFETSGTTRPWLIAALDDAMRDLRVTIRSPIAQQECRTFVIKPNGKAEHQDGCHDDCVLMLGLAAIGFRFAPRRKRMLPAAPHGKVMVPYGRAKHDEDD